MSSATKNENDMAIVASKRCLRLIRIAMLLQEKEASMFLLSRVRNLVGDIVSFDEMKTVLTMANFVEERG